MSSRRSKPLPAIIRDTREQAGYDFSRFGATVKDATLASGDYSLDGYEEQVAIERKSLADAFTSFGRERRRFERELLRLSSFRYAAVVIEADWSTILFKPPPFSQLKGKTIFRSSIAWEQRYGVSFWTCIDREMAEITTYRMLERFWIDYERA